MTYATAATGPGGALGPWRRAPLALRLVVVAVAAVLAVQLLTSYFGSIVGRRSAPIGATSPFNTGPNGTAAYVRLLEHAGDRVVVDASRLTPTRVPPGATLLVLDTVHWSDEDAATVRATLAGGGHVVFVGSTPAASGVPLPSGSSVTQRRRLVGAVTDVAASRLTFGVAALTTGLGELVTTGSVRVVVRGAGGSFVATAGATSWVASSAPLRNANLASLDNAALALNLTRPHGGVVVVDASNLRPTSTSSGLVALPPWWRSGVVVAIAAVVVWLLSAARRFGPLEPTSRPLAPPRAAHAEAMAALLEALPADQVRTAVAPVHDAARHALVRTLRLDDAASTAEITAVAADEGVPPWVVDAATSEVSSRDDAVRAGRALAWLHAERSLQ